MFISAVRPRRQRWLLVFVSIMVAVSSLAGGIRPAQAVDAPNLVISQVYGGGGNASAPYTHDFIEIFNRGTTTVGLNGLSVQYASASGTGNFAGHALPNVALAPGQYFLVRESSSSSTGAALPAHDAAGAISLSATAGKLVLVNGSANLACNGGSTPCSAAQLAQIIDLIGYGSANFYEGAAAAPTLSNTTAALRRANGCTDSNQNSSDWTAGSPTPRNTASPLTPCTVADAAPTVASVMPANSEADVALNANLSVTFSEAVNVGNGAITVACSVSGSHSYAISGGSTTFALNPDVDFANNELCTTTILAALVQDQDSNDPPDAMNANYSWSFTTVGNVCDAPFTPIYAIQGNSTSSPINGTIVTLEGVVTGDFQANGQLSGFFVQDQSGDGNSATSDGIQIFIPTANPVSSVQVAVGDVVRVRGTAKEFNTMTQIDTVASVTVCGTANVSATVLDLPETTNGDLERYEGMLVSIPETLTVSQNFFLGRYGQLTLSADGRMFNPTNSNDAGSQAAANAANLNARRVLILDDGSSAQNINPIPYIGADNTLRAGDTTANLTGVLDFGPISSTAGVRDYRLHPTVTPSFNRTNPRTAAPAAVGGNVKVASFNVLNYFTTLTSQSSTARGADTAAEFERQRTKIIAAISAINGDVVGLIELENNGSVAIGNLVDGLNTAAGFDKYALIADPATGVGTDAIKVGFIYQPARVTPIGPARSSTDPIFDRLPVAQTFELNNGERFTAVVNHFKSKGSCPSSGDVDTGQGCWNQKRVLQAEALLDFIATLTAGAGDDDVLVIGDLNAYGSEDPIDTLRNSGLTNQIAAFIGADAYSFVFDGLAGYLDHALTTASLTNDVTGVTEWHINADEPSIIDYNTNFKPQDLYSATPYRSSDHDPVIVGLHLNAPPTVEVNNFSVVEGGSVALTASGSDADGDDLTYAWDLDNNGSFETVGQNVTFSAANLDGPSSVTVAVRVRDVAGLTATAQTTITVINAAPVVNSLVTTPAPSIKGSAVVASATFSDAAPNDAPFTCTVNYGDGSGAVAGVINGTTCTAPAHVYSTVGAYTVVVSVSDKDGGTGTRSISHNVIFNWSGFFQPVDNLPTLNSVNAGRAIPVKFSLGGDQGLQIFAVGFPKSEAIACGSSGNADGIEETVTASNSSLSYSPTSDTYTYVWKTERTWAGTCRQLVVKLSDGTIHRANFQFR